MYIYGKHRIFLIMVLWSCTQINHVLLTTLTPCSSSEDCSDPRPVCCGLKGASFCRTSTDCIDVPCSSSFECDDGRMWCCSRKCKDSACLLPVWAIVVIALAVSIIISVLLIYVILECCRRWPSVRRTFC